ncbi:MAG: hypothetical protein IKJ99_03485 [Oscillospiraceae bacterium]|nr:hypothetical protein [Oscillospiraceae bacterium]
MAISFSDMTPEGKKFVRELNKLMDLEVQVGFQAGDATYENGADICEIAAYNEYGGSDRPARPFMKQSFENHEDELKAACNQVNKAIGQGGTAEAALKRLGVTAKGLVQDEIVNGGFAANAPSTIAKKKSATPLIDSSTMRGHVNYQIKPR